MIKTFYPDNQLHYFDRNHPFPNRLTVNIFPSYENRKPPWCALQDSKQGMIIATSTQTNSQHADETQKKTNWRLEGSTMFFQYLLDHLYRWKNTLTVPRPMSTVVNVDMKCDPETKMSLECPHCPCPQQEKKSITVAPKQSLRIRLLQSFVKDKPTSRTQSTETNDVLRLLQNLGKNHKMNDKTVFTDPLCNNKNLLFTKPKKDVFTIVNNTQADEAVKAKKLLKNVRNTRKKCHGRDNTSLVKVLRSELQENLKSFGSQNTIDVIKPKKPAEMFSKRVTIELFKHLVNFPCSISTCVSNSMASVREYNSTRVRGLSHLWKTFSNRFQLFEDYKIIADGVEIETPCISLLNENYTRCADKMMIQKSVCPQCIFAAGEVRRTLPDKPFQMSPANVQYKMRKPTLVEQACELLLCAENIAEAIRREKKCRVISIHNTPITKPEPKQSSQKAIKEKCNVASDLVKRKYCLSDTKTKNIYNSRLLPTLVSTFQQHKMPSTHNENNTTSRADKHKSNHITKVSHGSKTNSCIKLPFLGNITKCLIPAVLCKREGNIIGFDLRSVQDQLKKNRINITSGGNRNALNCDMKELNKSSMDKIENYLNNFPTLTNEQIKAIVSNANSTHAHQSILCIPLCSDAFYHVNLDSHNSKPAKTELPIVKKLIDKNINTSFKDSKFTKPAGTTTYDNKEDVKQLTLSKNDPCDEEKICVDELKKTTEICDDRLKKVKGIRDDRLKKTKEICDGKFNKTTELSNDKCNKTIGTGHCSNNMHSKLSNINIDNMTKTDTENNVGTKRCIIQMEDSSSDFFSEIIKLVNLEENSEEKSDGNLSLCLCNLTKGHHSIAKYHERKWRKQEEHRRKYSEYHKELCRRIKPKQCNINSTAADEASKVWAKVWTKIRKKAQQYQTDERKHGKQYKDSTQKKKLTSQNKRQQYQQRTPEVHNRSYEQQLNVSNSDQYQTGCPQKQPQCEPNNKQQRFYINQQQQPCASNSNKYQARCPTGQTQYALNNKPELNNINQQLEMYAPNSDKYLSGFHAQPQQRELKLKQKPYNRNYQQQVYAPNSDKYPSHFHTQPQQPELNLKQQPCNRNYLQQVYAPNSDQYQASFYQEQPRKRELNYQQKPWNRYDQKQVYGQNCEQYQSDYPIRQIELDKMKPRQQQYQQRQQELNEKQSYRIKQNQQKLHRLERLFQDCEQNLNNKYQLQDKRHVEPTRMVNQPRQVEPPQVKSRGNQEHVGPMFQKYPKEQKKRHNGVQQSLFQSQRNQKPYSLDQFCRTCERKQCPTKPVEQLRPKCQKYLEKQTEQQYGAQRDQCELQQNQQHYLRGKKCHIDELKKPSTKPINESFQDSIATKINFMVCRKCLHSDLIYTLPAKLKRLNLQTTQNDLKDVCLICLDSELCHSPSIISEEEISIFDYLHDLTGRINPKEFPICSRAPSMRRPRAVQNEQTNSTVSDCWITKNNRVFSDRREICKPSRRGSNQLRNIYEELVQSECDGDFVILNQNVCYRYDGSSIPCIDRQVNTLNKIFRG